MNQTRKTFIASALTALLAPTVPAESNKKLFAADPRNELSDSGKLSRRCETCACVRLEGGTLRCHKFAPWIMGKDCFAVFPLVERDYFCIFYERKPTSQEAK